jgi:hypothetical protein
MDEWFEGARGEFPEEEMITVDPLLNTPQLTRRIRQPLPVHARKTADSDISLPRPRAIPDTDDNSA